MNLKNIIYENIPCWYELSWQFEPPSIVLRVHKDYLDHLTPVLPTLEIVKCLQSTLKLGPFYGRFGGDWGFEQAMKWHGEYKIFCEWQIEIPTIKSTTNERCERCRGSGQDRRVFRVGEPCIWCGGTGQKFSLDLHNAYAIAASLYLWFMLIRFPEFEIQSSQSQLITIDLKVGERLWGISGRFSQCLVKWLSTLPTNKPISEVVAALKSAYQAMYAIRIGAFTNFQFQALVSNSIGSFHITVPGDACGVDPARHCQPGLGYEFGPHNIDNVMQLLTILAGLAALHDKARQEINLTG